MSYTITWDGPGGSQHTARTARAARDAVARILTDALAHDPGTAADVAEARARLAGDLASGARAVYAVGTWTLTIDPLE